MAFCGLGDYKGTSGKKKMFPKAAARLIDVAASPVQNASGAC